MEQLNARLVGVKSIWAAVEVIVEECILAAELTGLKGKLKKREVVNKALLIIRGFEARRDFVPTAAEGLVFLAIRVLLDRIVERVFRRLELEGKVNSAQTELFT